jgi:hypothetical protein
MKGDEHMEVILNKRAYEHTKRLVEKGRYVFDEKDIWSEHQPSAQEENEHIEENGFEEFGKWYLGVDTDEKEDTKGRINSLIAILPKYIAAVCLLQRTEPDNINIMILNRQPRICMA